MCGVDELDTRFMTTKAPVVRIIIGLISLVYIELDWSKIVWFGLDWSKMVEFGLVFTACIAEHCPHDPPDYLPLLQAVCSSSPHLTNLRLTSPLPRPHVIVDKYPACIAERMGGMLLGGPC